MPSDSTKRFSDRVDNYIKFRPGYPQEVLAFLKQECKLNADSVIADVGAGTGIFTRLLLDEGYKVYAVEPNQPMRDAAIEQLSAYKTFTPVDGTAEATTLPDKSADLIVCAQAFHWFNDAKTRIEFNRVLKDTGKAALIWNSRQTDVDEFAKAYEALLKHDGIDYNKVNHRKVRDIDFKAFFKDGVYTLTKYANTQIFDEAGLIGRAYSSSYVPKENTAEGEKFLVLLKEIFNKYNVDGKVSFVYETEIYLGEV